MKFLYKDNTNDNTRVPADLIFPGKSWNLQIKNNTLKRLEKVLNFGKILEKRVLRNTICYLSTITVIINIVDLIVIIVIIHNGR